MAPLDILTLKQLRALCAVAEFGSITAAAETLGLTTPAVHNQLKILSENLGSSLLQKGVGGRMILTQEGQVVLDSAIRVETELNRCLRDVDALRSGRSGSVDLGVVSTGKYFAPRLVAQLQAQLPDITINLRIGNRGQIISEIETGAVQIAIMGRPPRQPDVNARVIGPHPHVFIAPPDHALALVHEIPPQRLLQETFLSRESGSGTRILMQRFLDRIGDGQPYDTVVMDSNETIKQAVIAGLGIALISVHTVADELETGRLITFDMEGLPIERQWYLLHRADLELGTTAGQVWERISAMGGGFLPQPKAGRTNYGHVMPG